MASNPSDLLKDILEQMREMNDRQQVNRQRPLLAQSRPPRPRHTGARQERRAVPLPSSSASSGRRRIQPVPGNRRFQKRPSAIGKAAGQVGDRAALLLGQIAPGVAQFASFIHSLLHFSEALGELLDATKSKFAAMPRAEDMQG